MKQQKSGQEGGSYCLCVSKLGVCFPWQDFLKLFLYLDRYFLSTVHCLRSICVTKDQFSRTVVLLSLLSQLFFLLFQCALQTHTLGFFPFSWGMHQLCITISCVDSRDPPYGWVAAVISAQPCHTWLSLCVTLCCWAKCLQSSWRYRKGRVGTDTAQANH